MSVSLCPSFGVGWQGFTSGGIPLNAGLLYTYAAGGTTPQATYTTSAGNVQCANPIVLAADGRPTTEIWLTDGQSYRLDLTDSLGNLIKTYDNVAGGQPYSASSGSSLIGFIGGETGAVATTVQADLRSQLFIPAARFGIVADGTDQTTKMINALKSGENISLPRGVIGLDGAAGLAFTSTGIVGGTQTHGQKLIGAGCTDVANAPTQGTVLLRLSGTGPMLTIPFNTFGNELGGFCFNSNGLAGYGIKTGMHEQGYIHDIIFYNQFGSYGMLCTGMNLSTVERIGFTGTCYGGILMDNTAAVGYGALYSNFNKIQFSQAIGALTNYGLDATLSSTLTFNDFFVQGGKGVNLHASLEDITFNQLRGELAGQVSLLVADGSGGAITGLNVNGGRVSCSTTNAVTTAFFQINTVYGFHLDKYEFLDSVSAANRPYIGINAMMGSSITNIKTRNTSGNSHYCVLAATARSDGLTMDNVNTYGTSATTNRLWNSDLTISNSNMDLTFVGASQRVKIADVSGAVNFDNVNSGGIVEGGLATFTDNNKLAVTQGYRGQTGVPITVNADAMAANEISLIDSVGRNGNVFIITGTKTITSIDAASTIAGREVTLQFTGILTFTDGNNLKLAGNFVTSADDTITLVCTDGTNWYEKSRSAN